MLFVVIHKSAQSYNISHTYTSPAQKKPDRSWKPHQNNRYTLYAVYRVHKVYKSTA